MKTYSILINQTGLNQIASALREHHKQGNDVTDDMVSAYASDAENSYTHGHDVTFEIGTSESLTGRPVVIKVGRDWYDLHEYDDFEDEDRVVEWPTNYIHFVNNSPSDIRFLMPYFKEAYKTGILHDDISDLFVIKMLKNFNPDGSDRMLIYAA